jgi:aminopeptidase N
MVREGTVDGIRVRSYSWQAGGDGGALQTATQSLALFGQTYGPYPYGEYSVVQADFFIGGMEYPGMVLIDGTLYAPSLTGDVVRDIVVSHETAHQWWYGVVGDDEVQTPWLDEGLTEFSTQLFFRQMRSSRYNRLYESQGEALLQQRRDTQIQSGPAPLTATTPVYGFADNTDYSAWVYDRTAAVLQELRGRLGDKVFFRALRAYYDRNRLSVATAEDLMDAFEQAGGQDLRDWFAQKLTAVE